jgi:hypothetical protein
MGRNISNLLPLLLTPFPSIRAICAQWIGRTKRGDDRPLLRELAKDLQTEIARMEPWQAIARSQEKTEAFVKFTAEAFLQMLLITTIRGPFRAGTPTEFENRTFVDRRPDAFKYDMRPVCAGPALPGFIHKKIHYEAHDRKLPESLV